MVRNIIEQFDPDGKFVTEVQDLQRKFEQLKFSQAPTVYETLGATVTFTIAPILAGVPIIGNETFRHTILDTLQPPNGQVLMAIPEFQLYTQVNGIYYHYPNDWSFSGILNYQNCVALKWWLSWAANDNKNIVAVIDVARQDYGGNDTSHTDNNPDGTTGGTLNMQLYARWRYIQAGSS